MALDFQKVFTILEDYKRKAINEENNDYEKSRHTHFGELFDVNENDSMFESIRLDGSSPDVIKLARKSLEKLSNCSMVEYKNPILKMGKQIVKRSTPQIKNLFSKLRNDEKALLTFLQWLFKSEVEILQIDEGKSKDRFGSGKNKNNVASARLPIQNSSFIETQKMNYIPLEDIVDDYLFSSSECNYKQEAFDDYKSKCHKMSKVVSVLIDYLYAKNSKATSGDITIEAVATTFDIIPEIPKRQGSISTTYSYYDYYEKLKNTDYTKKAVSNIKTDLLNYNCFIKYLEDKGYITSVELKQTQKHYQNIKRRLSNNVRDGEIEEGGRILSL